MRKLGIFICVGILGFIASEVMAKKQIRNDFTNRRQYIASKASDLQAIYTINRVTGSTTLTADHHIVFVDTDAADIPIALPVGVAGTEYRIVNVGTSGNIVTLTPDGSELLGGSNSSDSLLDGDVLIIIFDSTEGWY